MLRFALLSQALDMNNPFVLIEKCNLFGKCRKRNILAYLYMRSNSLLL